MIITLKFDAKSKPSTANCNSFQLDIDANDSIENLKALISLRYTDLEPDTFDLFHKGQMIKTNHKCLFIQEVLNTTELEIVVNGRMADCCKLI